MFKYIKWELINELKNKKLLLGVIAITYLLVYLLPASDNVIIDFLYLLFSIILFMTGIFAFFYGAKRTMDSFKNQTFLLESMIPLSPSKILLAKYLLAILFNFVFCAIFVLGLSVIFAKSDINLINLFIQGFLQLDADSKTFIFRAFIQMISYTIAYTSIISCLYIGLKSFFPNGKGLRGIAFVVGLFLLSLLQNILVDHLPVASFDIMTSIIMLIITIICYFGSVWFIENKLEVYS